jgi:chromosome segregation ATPase
MNAADRFAHEIAQRDQQDDELRRRAAPTLVYKTTTSPIEPTPIPSSPSPRSINAEIKKQLSSHLKARDRLFVDAVAAFVVMRGRKLREQLQREDNIIKDQLQRLQGEVAALREQADRDRERAECERSLTRQAIETSRGECESLHRTINALREQLAIERGFAALKEDIAVAKADIPRLPDIEAQVNAKQAAYKREQDGFARELKTTKDRIGHLMVEQSQTNYNLKQLQHQRPPVVELRFESEDGQFTMHDLHPDAATAWRRFAKEMIEANEGIMYPTDPTGLVVPLAARKPQGNA